LGRGIKKERGRGKRGRTKNRVLSFLFCTENILLFSPKSRRGGKREREKTTHGEY